ncbi:hypothetical protein M0802_002419 [Mischocyttarus mexicanus]|nr:hypothetical protein M0802_002419 [Mischocyttarus mexicanus]
MLFELVGIGCTESPKKNNIAECKPQPAAAAAAAADAPVITRVYRREEWGDMGGAVGVQWGCSRTPVPTCSSDRDLLVTREQVPVVKKTNTNMTTESLPREVDAHIVNILTKISNMRDNIDVSEKRIPMSTEARSLELWKAVLVECVATFLFVFVVSGAASSTAVSGSGLSILATSIASGFVISAIYLIFGHVGGSHINPAVSLSFLLLRRISPLRSALYIAAQCGGGIAGFATLYTKEQQQQQQQQQKQQQQQQYVGVKKDGYIREPEKGTRNWQARENLEKVSTCPNSK